MAVELDHTIVPARDKVASARFLARILGVQVHEGAAGHFTPVRVNDRLTLDYCQNSQPTSHHYAFKVSEAEFDEVLGRLKADGVAFGGGPFSRTDGRIYDLDGGRRVYFDDPNGHVLEVLTVS